MADVRTVDMQLINQLFETDPGYVLDFSNHTFATFFNELKIDIYADSYGEDGGSKGKRFRCFLRKTDNARPYVSSLRSGNIGRSGSIAAISRTR